MGNIHTTLKPSTNIALIFIWGIFGGFFIYITVPLSFYIAGIGFCFGIVCGAMQYAAFIESKEKFLETETMLDVKRKLTQTKWGKRYIPVLWCSSFIIILSAFFIDRDNFLYEFAAGYLSLMFIREIITLKSTYELEKMSERTNKL